MSLTDLYNTPSTILSLQPTDVALTAGIAAAAGLWLFVWQRLTASHVVSSTVTRKVIHITCGPLYLFLWPFYSAAPSARLLAALVPLCFISLLAISGSARADQTTRASLGRAISREGKAADALQGPLYYSIILLLSSLLLFKSVAAVLVVAQLCFGDGAAEAVGRRFGASSRWGLPWTGDKSVAGTAGFVLAAFAGSCAGFAWWNYWGLSELCLESGSTVASLAAVSLACAALELAPREVAGDDNFTIAAAAAVLGFVCFGAKAF